MIMSQDIEMALPAGIPVLDRGRHFHPELGGCFMEIASVLAGERWSDHPRCTHPLLAELARTVNDLVDDEARQRLVVRIPDVVGANRRHPVITAELVAVLAGHGVAVRPDDARLRWAANRACRRAAAWTSGRRWRRTWLTLTDAWFRSDDRVRVPTLVRAFMNSGDDALIAALSDAISTYHRVAERLDAEPARDGAAHAPARAGR